MLTGWGRWVLSLEMSQSPQRGSAEGGEDLSAKYDSTCAPARGCWQRGSPVSPFH